MKITNKAGLPEGLVRAIQNDNYDNGGADYTITGLLSPPRISVLKKEHEDKLEDDASNMVWALIGKIGHSILQLGAIGRGDLVEKRFFTLLRGKKISGQCDFSTSGILTDFKFVSVWSVKEGIKPEWVAQLAGYRWLAAKNDIDLRQLQIVAILRDWSVGEARRDPNYPQSQVLVLNSPLWDLSTTEKFFAERLLMHESAKKKLPECTAEERWQKSDEWKVVKDGNKRALKIHYSEVSARQHLKEMGKNYHVEFFAGESVRCLSYCNVAPFCSQWKAIQAAMPKAETEKETY